jgi:hypothetical protein
MALTATDQTSEKIIVAFIIATCHILVFLQTRLSRIKYILINDAWNRDFNPVLHRGCLDAFTSSYRQQGRFAPSCRNWSGTPAVGHTNISRRMQNAPNRGWIPMFASSWSGNLLFVQLFDNPVHRDRCFWVSIPGKDLPYNGRFDRVNPHPVRIPRPFRVQDISVRRSGPRQQAPGSEFGLPSTPHSICNQVALVFGHRPSDLKQELVMGIILLHRAFQKVDITTQFFHLLDQQYLMHIFTRQSIRCGYQDQLESCHAGGISQTIQSRTIELGPRVTIVAIHMLRSQLPIGILNYCLLQSLNLLFNALTLHLTVGRYSGINGDLHGHSPEWVIPGDVAPQSAPSSSAEETDRYNPNEVAHRNILRLRDELAILFSFFLLNVVSHLGEAYPKFLFPQSQRAAPPRQLQLSHWRRPLRLRASTSVQKVYSDSEKSEYGGNHETPVEDFSRSTGISGRTALLEAFSTPVADSLAAWAYYQAISSAVTVLVYGMVVAITWPLIANTGWFASTGLRLDNFERLMLVFGLAGLVNLFIAMILSLFWSGVLQGDALPGLNFIKEWGAGLLLLLVLIGLIYWRLGRSQV